MLLIFFVRADIGQKRQYEVVSFQIPGKGEGERVSGMPGAHVLR